MYLLNYFQLIDLLMFLLNTLRGIKFLHYSLIDPNEFMESKIVYSDFFF